MKNIICLCSLAVVLFTNVSYSIAKVDITPSVTLREEYNDNLFLTESDEKSDYTTVISPGILLEYSPNSLLDISLEYGFDFRFYSRYNEFNDTSIVNTQKINFQAQARPAKRIFLDVSDIYKRVPVDTKKIFASNNPVINMTENNVFTISPYVVLPLSSTVSTKLGYKYDNSWYKKMGYKIDRKLKGLEKVDENTDSQSHTAFLTLSKKLSSQLNGDVKYTYNEYIPTGDKTSSAIKNYNSHRASIAMDYQIRQDFTIKGEIGEGRYNYEASDDFDQIFWNINVDYKFMIAQSTSLGAGYVVSLKDSSTSGTYKSSRFDMYFKAGNILKMSVNPFYTNDKYIKSARKDRIEGITANIIYPLTSRTDISLDGQWERQKYQPENEKVNKYSAGITMDYKYRERLTASLGYKSEGRNSDIDTKDFTNNIVSLQAKVVF